jgi:DUF1680 family protein
MSLSRRAFTFGVTHAPMLPFVEAVAQAVSPPAPLDQVSDQYQPAPLEAQAIQGILGQRLQVNIEKRLLGGVELEALLAGYKKRPGQQTWVGEHAAKFIDAATNAAVYSGDHPLRQKVDTAVRELLATQLPDGYLGTYDESSRWKDWDVWAHKYNLIALLNYYDRTGYEPALAACKRMGDLLVKTYGTSEGQRSIVLNDWHVGMANSSLLEPMAALYRHTGDPGYLEFCNYIVRAWNDPKGPKIISSLLETGSVRRVANNKGYEMMSNFVGLLELYRITGDQNYLNPVLIAWKDIVSKRLYVTGTSTWGEHFQGDYFLRADDAHTNAGVGEGCVTTTWLQMNLQLLRLTGESKYADELERTIYNALLGAQNPTNGRICYFLPLNGMKRYGEVSQGINGVSCCTSSIPRALALIPAIVWGKRKGGIAINLYTPGTLRLAVSGVDVRVTSMTTYPLDGHVELELRMAKPVEFTLSLRVPAWVSHFTVRGPGQNWSGSPGSYLEISREWTDLDRVMIDMDMSARLLSGGPAYPEYVAVQRGPQVLAVDKSLNRNVEVWIAGLSAASDEELLLRQGPGLPPKWQGSQAYEANGFFGNSGLGITRTALILVPLGDAGQTGGEYRVWLRRP